MSKHWPGHSLSVPANSDLERFLERCRAEQRVPTEVSRGQFVQEILIRHDTWSGQIEVSSPTRNIDALQELGVLWDAMRIVARSGVFAETRARLRSGRAGIALSLNESAIEALFDPPDDPTVLKGLLVAALCHLSDLCEAADFNPFESLAGLIRFEVKVE